MNLFSLATDGVDLDALPLEQSQQPRASFKFAEASEPARLRLPRELDDVFGFAAQEYGVDVDVLRGIAYAESRFNPDIISGKVKSPAGAIGLMQFMPETAQEYGIDPTDPVQAIMGGAAYLRKSLDKFDGDYGRAVASYNWGPNRKAYDSEDWASKAPQETQKYLMTVFGAVGKFKDGAAEQPAANKEPMQATPLPAGVAPSTAGGGRGSVSPGMVNTKLTRTAVPDMTVGSVAQDIGSGLLQVGPTAVKGVGELVRLATGDRLGQGITDFAERGIQATQDIVGSGRAAAQRQNLAADMADDSVSLGQAIASNKGALSDQILPTLGSMAIPLGAAGVAGKAATVGRAAQGMSKAAMAARVASVQQAAGIGATAAQNAASTFAEMVDNGVSMPDAYKAAGITVPFSLIAGKLTGGGAEGALIKGLSGQSVARGAVELAKAPLREGAQEGGESLGQVAGEVLGAGQDVSLQSGIKRVGTEALLGAVVGGGMGAVQQIAAPRVESQPTTPQAPPVAPAAPAQSGTPPVAPTTPAAQGTADAIMELERRLQAAANPTAQPTADAGTTPVAPTGNAGATEGAGGTVAAAADGQPEQAQALSVPENFTATPAATVGTQTSVQAGPGFTGKGIAAEMAALRARSQPAPVATQPATQQAEQPRTTKAAQPAKANLDPQGLLSDDERQMLGEFTRLYQADLKADIRQRLGMTPKEQATAQVEKKKPSALLSLIVQMGGIKSGLSADLTGANAMEGNRRHPGLFRNNGKQLDVLVQSLKERGYLTQADEDSILDNGSTNKLADMIQAELSGERAKLVDNTDGFEAMRDADMRQGMEDKATALGLSQDMVNSMSDSRLNGTIKRIEARLGHPIKTDFATRKMSRAEARAEREAILMADRYERARAKYDAELQVFAEADDMVQDAVLDVVVDEDGNVEIVYARAVEVAAASDALNGTWSDQNAEVDTRRVGAGQENSGQAGPPVASTAEAGAGNPEANRSEASAGSQETLTTYTPEEVTAQQEAAEKAERTAKAKKQADDLSAKKEQERKEIAQASVAAADTFELGQDAMANLTGQNDLQFSRDKESHRTPASTIRQAITKAYGNLLDKLEAKGLVTIAQTEREAIEAAAQARADKTGGDVERIKRSMLASVQMQRVWHGSPHRFDKFSTEFMGKGEGAQAFGWGLYYASKREIAESYRGTLTYRDMVRKFRNAMPDDASIEDASEWADSGDAPKDMARVIKALSADDWLGFDYPAQALTALFKEPANFDISKELADAAKAMQGQLYEVEIPEDGDMLLWDKPLSEQPENVLAALRRGYDEQGGDYPDKSATPKTGREIYNDFRALAGGFESMDQRAASEYLASLGIKGIKYLDGTSRNAGDGSYNYVIFDGADTQIVDVKYSANGNIEGFFDRQTGKSFLVADNLTAASAPGTLMHEVGIHMAADGKLEPLFNRAAQLLKLNKNNPFLQRVQARMDQSGETSAEEAAAYIVTEYENDRANAPASVAQWVKDFIADVRAWLFGKGVLLKADQLTVADIAAVARANAKSMAMGDSQGDVRNSKAPNVYEWADRESAPVGAWVKADYKLADSQPVYPGNSGQFDTATPDIRRSISNRAQQPLFNQTPAHTWEELGESYVDTKLYNWQDDRIDLKRVQDSITKAGRQIDDQFDARTAETLLPGRLAKRTEDFMAVEAAPLLKDMAKNNVTMEEVSDYMLARHAPERNAQIAKVNPDMPDAGSGTNSEGVLMTTQAANDHIAALTTGKRMVLEMLARRVDAITKGTRDLLVAEGLEKAETIRAWEGAYKHYVPLFRDEAANTPGHPVGSGISVTGSASKRATGSSKEVTNMLAHVLMQREAAITRAEKNRVGMSLYGMALSHPNKAFWSTVQPKMSTADIVAELQRMGVDPMDGIMGMDAAPTIRTVDDRTGLVVDRPNPMYKKLDNAIVVKVNGEDRVILFNTKNERAMRMAESLKNQHFDQGMWVNAANTVAPVTRFMSAMMTQYNPAFGMVNAVRDIQGALVNLTSTPLNGKQARVLADTPAAVIGIARDIRGDGKRTPWSDLWVQFQEDGGRTGYRDLVVSPYERAANMEKDIKRMQQEGKWTPGNAAHAVLDLLGDFNDSLENGVRLAAYKAALDKGMTRPQAAKLGRELTVDFNRKGRKGRELGKLYAFLNASIQGNARNVATVMGAHGGKVLAGGFALGVLQALMLAWAGYEDDEIREFQKARALIIPIGGKQHITIPMALGFHIIPNASRILTELMLTGGKDWQTKVPEAMFEIANAANPFGGGGDWKTAHGPLTMVMPTAGDWAVDLALNRDFTGNQISRTRYNERNPGSAIARESTLRTPSGQVYQGISKAINDLTGGSDRKAGAVSPTPEELRYIMGVVGGGVYRETEKAINAAVMLVNGDEIKATQVPLGSRFVSEVRDEDVQRSRYYKNSRTLEGLEADLKDAAKDRDSAKMNELRQDKLTNAIGLNNAVQRHITQINKMAKDDIGDKAAMAQHDANRAAAMRRLNDEVLKLEKQAQ